MWVGIENTAKDCLLALKSLASLLSPSFVPFSPAHILLPTLPLPVRLGVPCKFSFCCGFAKPTWMQEDCPMLLQPPDSGTHYHMRFDWRRPPTRT